MTSKIPAMNLPMSSFCFQFDFLITFNFLKG